MKNFLLFFSGLFLISGVLLASDPKDFSQEESKSFEPTHVKLVTTDASPVDPGHVELIFSYLIRGGKFGWKTDMERYKHGKLLIHEWMTQTTVGIYKNIDLGIIQGFQHLSDKENNYNEVAGMIDPLTGAEMADPTGGPGHGFGRTDLGITGRWRFFTSEKHKLEVAYNPTVFVPTGRRSNFDHLGPSQGFTSFENAIAITKDLGRWSTNSHIGYHAPLASMERTENYAGAFHMNGAVGYQVCRWLHPELELVWLHEFEKHGKGGKILSLVAGTIIPVNNHVRFDLGVQQDLFGSGTEQNTAGIFKIAVTI